MKELADQRHIFLAPLSKEATSYAEAVEVLTNLLEPLTSGEFNPKIEQSNYISSIVALKPQAFIESQKMANSDILAIQNAHKFLILAQKSYILKGSFDLLFKNIRLFLTKALILSYKSVMESPNKKTQLSINFSNAKPLLETAYSLLKDSNLKVDPSWWPKINSETSKIIKEFKEIKIPMFKQLILFQRNPIQFIKYEVINMIMYSYIEANLDEFVVKARHLIDNYYELLPNKIDLTSIAVIALKETSNQQEGKERNFFLTSVASYIFEKFTKDEEIKTVFRIIQRHLKSKVKFVDNHNLNDFFTKIYKENERSLIETNDQEIKTKRSWAIKSWDILVHQSLNHEFSLEFSRKIAENLADLMVVEKTYVNNYEQMISLISNILFGDFDYFDYFKTVWMHCVDYRIIFLNFSHSQFDDFISNVLTKKNRNRSSDRYLIILKLVNGFLNSSGESDVVNFKVGQNTDTLEDFKTTLSTKEFEAFDRLIGYLYLEQRQLLSPEDIEDKKYIDWILESTIPCSHFGFFKSKHDKFLESGKNRLINEKLEEYFNQAIKIINLNFSKPSIINAVVGNPFSEELNYLRYSDNIVEGIESRPEFNSKGVKTSITYIRVVPHGSELFEKIAAAAA
jgi:hypothetical protein